MTNLPRETQPDSALEERVVSALVAAGLVRRRRAWPLWTAAAALPRRATTTSASRSSLGGRTVSTRSASTNAPAVSLGRVEVKRFEP